MGLIILYVREVFGQLISLSWEVRVTLFAFKYAGIITVNLFHLFFFFFFYFFLILCWVSLYSLIKQEFHFSTFSKLLKLEMVPLNIQKHGRLNNHIKTNLSKTLVLTDNNVFWGTSSQFQQRVLSNLGCIMNSVCTLYFIIILDSSECFLIDIMFHRL